MKKSPTIKSRKASIVKVLKSQGKYIPELFVQIELLANLLMQLEKLNLKMSAENYSPIITEVSREGNERAVINPIETLYLQYYDRAQRAIKALGMNTDSRGIKIESDNLRDFIDAVSNADDDE